MLQNNLDPEVAERPDDLVVYGGTGRAARSWEAFDAMCRTLRTLADDETMLVQSGKPVGVFRTHEWAPRVLIANSNLVPDWATWTEFRRLEAAGLTMYGQMTAGSWIYIGTQGILQGTYECFAEIARRRFGGSLAGTITLTAGLGGMGGAQPLAITMNDGVALCIDVDPPASSGASRRATSTRSPTTSTTPSPAAPAPATSGGRCRSASSATPPRCCRGCSTLDFPADIVTDQTSAHDPLSYVPVDVTPEAAAEMARTDPEVLIRRARESMATHCAAMVGFLDGGAEVFDYGNSLRAEAELGGFDRAFAYPGFLPAYIRPLFCEGKGPFRWVALSGDPADIAATDRAVLEEFPDDEGLARWIHLAGERVAFQGLPARICWLGYGERPPRRALQRAGPPRRRCRRRSSSAATTSTRARSPRRTARPRRWPTAPTPSPTGRCSTRSSTRRRARRGCRSTTAAASASAARSTPGWSPSPTAPTSPRRSWSGC